MFFESFHIMHRKQGKMQNIQQFEIHFTKQDSEFCYQVPADLEKVGFFSQNILINLHRKKMTYPVVMFEISGQ